MSFVYIYERAAKIGVQSNRIVLIGSKIISLFHQNTFAINKDSLFLFHLINNLMAVPLTQARQ